MATSSRLFDPSLISSEIRDTMPTGYRIRPLEKADYGKGFLECLQVLTWMGDVTEAEFLERYEEMVAAKGTYYFLVIEYEGRIIGTGALIVEKKFIHNRGTIGHIEEISIAKEHQGKGLGMKMVNGLDSVAVNIGCYKDILNCSKRNEPFYVKCGYHVSGNEMSHYFEEEQDAYHRG